MYYYLVAANINRNIHLSYWVVAHEKNLAVYIETFLASPSTGGLLRYEYCLRWVFTIWLSTLVLTGLEIIFAHEPCTSSAVRRYFRTMLVSLHPHYQPRFGISLESSQNHKNYTKVQTQQA